MKKHVSRIIEFLNQDENDSINFSGLSTSQRVILHNLASLVRLKHVSSGSKSDRVLTISKNNIEYQNEGDNIIINEHIVIHRYICVKGEYISTIASLYAHKIPVEYISKRINRDKSDEYHITLISSNELKSYGWLEDEEKKSYLIKNLSMIKNDWKLKGLGRAQQGEDETYFLVIDWESAQEFLDRMGLPRRDFHITLGFKNNDIHNVPKNESSLINS